MVRCHSVSLRKRRGDPIDLDRWKIIIKNMEPHKQSVKLDSLDIIFYTEKMGTT